MKLEPPTRKMELEETLALTPALSPQERGKHAQFPEFSRPLVLELLRGDSRRLLQGTSIFTTRLSEHRALTRRSVDSRRFAQFAEVPRPFVDTGWLNV